MHIVEEYISPTTF